MAELANDYRLNARKSLKSRTLVWPQRPHVPSIRVKNTRTHFVSEPEYRALVEGLPAYLQPLIEFLYLTGWRVGEALGLSWADVEDDPSLFVLTLKS